MLKIKLLKKTLGLNRIDTEFRLILALSFSLSFLNIIYKFRLNKGVIEAAFNLWSPCWLLFGPLLFFAYQISIGKIIKLNWKQGRHLLPFICFGVFYLYLFFTTDMSNAWANPYFGFYQNSYGIMVISLVPYSIYVLSKILIANTDNKANTDTLIISLGAIYILISVITLMMVIDWSVFSNSQGVDYRYFTYGLLFFANIVILWYLLKADQRISSTYNQSMPPTIQKLYKNSALNVDVAIEYKQRILDFFENSTIYLESNITLELLSKELNIPKHHFSQLFRMYFERNFHTFVAEYRIMHAIELLKNNNGRLKIESLAYSCGFNSKTSFNRYFKEKTGYTPSDFQIYLTRQIA